MKYTMIMIIAMLMSGTAFASTASGIPSDLDEDYNSQSIVVSNPQVGDASVGDIDLFLPDDDADL